MDAVAAAKRAAKRASARVAARREALRHAPRVKAAAWNYWSTFGKGMGEELTKAEYMSVHRLIARALAPELNDEEAVLAAEKDWGDDLGELELSRQSAMTFQLYLDSLLEIADMWTVDVDDTEYAVFLHKVYRRVTKPVAPSIAASKSTKAKPANSGQSNASPSRPADYDKVLKRANTGGLVVGEEGEVRVWRQVDEVEPLVSSVEKPWRERREGDPSLGKKPARQKSRKAPRQSQRQSQGESAANGEEGSFGADEVDSSVRRQSVTPRRWSIQARPTLGAESSWEGGRTKWAPRLRAVLGFLRMGAGASSVPSVSPARVAANNPGQRQQEEGGGETDEEGDDDDDDDEGGGDGREGGAAAAEAKRQHEEEMRRAAYTGRGRKKGAGNIYSLKRRSIVGWVDTDALSEASASSSSSAAAAAAAAAAASRPPRNDRLSSCAEGNEPEKEEPDESPVQPQGVSATAQRAAQRRASVAVRRASVSGVAPTVGRLLPSSLDSAGDAEVVSEVLYGAKTAPAESVEAATKIQARRRGAAGRASIQFNGERYGGIADNAVLPMSDMDKESYGDLMAFLNKKKS